MTTDHARFQGSIPELYDQYLGPVIFSPYALDLARRIAAASPRTLLEVACGTGITTAPLRTALASCAITATDLNAAMIAYARAKPDMPAGIDWRTADAAALPFDAASFDALACQFGYMFVPDKAKAFAEARRVLKRDGLFAFNLWDSLRENPFAAIANTTIDARFPGNPPNFYSTPMGFHDASRVRAMLDAAGFTATSIELVKLPAQSVSAEAFAVGLVKGNPVALAIAERDGAIDAIVKDVAVALAREGGDAPYRSTMQALVVTARAG
ncbi:MAG TPA: methyltransferase domain-containing protein [Casimicrobiaceae bacterium]|nr:methyltransferase domain-containing protein [Casimicrobiaceae bacterium]